MKSTGESCRIGPLSTLSRAILSRVWSAPSYILPSMEEAIDNVVTVSYGSFGSYGYGDACCTKLGFTKNCIWA